MPLQTDELRTQPLGPLPTPTELSTNHPLTDDVAKHIDESRGQIEKILTGEDKRLLVIVGPCSIHDTDAAIDYAKRLVSVQEKYKDQLFIVMRTYFEKPRTIIGWKGLITDPNLDGSYALEAGLNKARKLLLDINKLGLPTATEFLDMITGQYITDLISWGAIGARTLSLRSTARWPQLFLAQWVSRTVLTAALRLLLTQCALRKHHTTSTLQTRMAA
ncbi:2-keto-3-deoxy-D-arabino-heptulosonate-7-phosphate synthase I alpha [Vibrio sp. JCM 19236]|nr:2-keto-3-deoxy-D-arabino-heptulosonate-7-phosphate synthase I alpha [Vibrio sp. JCM 19236]